ncbi:NAD-dependent epimerase/dehydratase family protein [Saccharothrix deserti]|uniref:NAD-dependent epimerase/dehydratase family protein n=1 Tax=Saccharothrix deserti TaxID=2593674 RepID=UPI00131ADCFE|nr:NAD-dependent epimerase/dehydratase family protein [Saccharothrix deserti]
MDVVVVTGSAGLVGGAAVRAFAPRFDLVVGVDNLMRRDFFGHGAVAGELAELSRLPNHRHHAVDVRDEAAIGDVLREYGSDVRLVVHAAGQPSAEWATGSPLVDFGVNALGTVTVLEAVRRHCPDAVVAVVSTTKVYGAVPDALPLVETATRWEIDPAHPFHEHGFDESLRLDHADRTFFGVSKLAADLAAQEYGRRLGMNVGVFRCGAVAGFRHAGVELHGFLSHLVRSAVRGAAFPVIGHGGKQVRDVLGVRDLVEMFWQFYLAPRPGEVYHAGGGRERSASVLELIAQYEYLIGRPVRFEYRPEHRFADVRCWITDTRKFRRDYPVWQPTEDLVALLLGLHEHWSAAAVVSP